MIKNVSSIELYGFSEELWAEVSVLGPGFAIFTVIVIATVITTSITVTITPL